MHSSSSVAMQPVCLRRAKRDDPDLEVVVFEKGEWVSYGACGLPYYIKGDIVGALEEGATVFELENYDLAYAPPFNTTWDPVLVAAKVLGGQLR